MSERLYIDRDAGPEPKTIEQVEQDNQKLVERGVAELELIAPALKKLITEIETFKPDIVVFLDKGARILGTPIMKVLRDRNTDLNWQPQIVFFNDGNLKGTLVHGAPESQYTEGVLHGFRGKKVFFVDETVSSGIGAAALLHASTTRHFSPHYFAVTYDSNATVNKDKYVDMIAYGFGISTEKATTLYEKIFSTVKNNPNCAHGDIMLDELFTKAASKLYVDENPATDETQFRYGKLESDEHGEAYTYLDTDDIYKTEYPFPGNPNIRSTREKENPPAGRFNPYRKHNQPPSFGSWQDYDQAVRKENINTIKKLKQLIIDATQKALITNI